jgi:hypothetical protein
MSYPHRTIDEADVMHLAKSDGFRCAARLEESSRVYRYRGQGYGKQLIFLRA